VAGRQARIATAITGCVFTRAGRAEQEHVCAAGDCLLDARRIGEVELLERLSGRKARGADTALAAVGLTRGHLGCEHGLGETLEGPLLAARALGDLRQRACNRRSFQLAAQEHQLRGELAHAGINTP
jgi:hypothetical protein